VASVRETSVKGKHRTEATEVTEEELGLGVERSWWTPWLLCGKRALKESIAQRSQRPPEEELGLGVEGSWWTPWLLWEKRPLKEKHRTEVTEEGIGVADESDLF
jgi:hypothetical protein